MPTKIAQTTVNKWSSIITNVQQLELIEFEIDGRIQKVRPVGSGVLDSGNVVADALAVSLDKPLGWAIGFLFGNTELSLELWTVIVGISRFDN